jgi:hypothetical protein
MNWKPWSPVDDSGDEPRSVRESLDAIASNLGVTTPHAVVRVFGDWEAIVGPVIAAHSRPERLRDGQLLVVVDEPAWATELRVATETILERVNAALGERGERADELVLRVVRQGRAGTASPDTEPGPRHGPGRAWTTDASRWRRTRKDP